MGTLLNQTPRMDRLTVERIIAVGRDIKEVSKILAISFTEAQNLYLAVAKIDDYDTKDEQLMGLGELLTEFLEKERNPSCSRCAD